jgi:hypothetical protein
MIGRDPYTLVTDRGLHGLPGYRLTLWSVVKGWFRR